MSNSPWMTVRDAAAYRRCSHDTIERNRVPWTEQAPPAGQWRYKLMQNGKLRVPRYWREDIEAGFFVPETGHSETERGTVNGGRVSPGRAGKAAEGKESVSRGKAVQGEPYALEKASKSVGR